MTEPLPADSEASTAPLGAVSGHRRRRSPDGVTTGLLALSAFLLVLALLGSQLTSARSTPAPRRPVVVRRIYRTTVLEKVLPAGSGPKDGTSVNESSSPAPAEPAATAPVTRVS